MLKLNLTPRRDSRPWIPLLIKVACLVTPLATLFVIVPIHVDAHAQLRDAEARTSDLKTTFQGLPNPDVQRNTLERERERLELTHSTLNSIFIPSPPWTAAILSVLDHYGGGPDSERAGLDFTSWSLSSVPEGETLDTLPIAMTLQGTAVTLARLDEFLGHLEADPGLDVRFRQVRRTNMSSSDEVAFLLALTYEDPHLLREVARP